jgi:hypothetical protein
MVRIEACENTILGPLAWHLCTHYSVPCREVFAHGDMQSMHDLQLLQELRREGRSLQCLSVIAIVLVQRQLEKS